MTERVFQESIYRFTDPIRYFTANDPYYYQVDNIPLKQLQENDNFLKDQIESLLVSGAADSRSSFTELKPYVDGTSNIVKVKPGRFSARINDAYGIDPIQFVTQITGATQEYNSWQVGTINNEFIVNVLNKFKENLAENMTGMNGLYERSFTFGMANINAISQYITSSSPGYSTNDIGAPFPNFTGKLWDTNGNSIVATKTMNNNNDVYGFLNIGNAEVEFARRWKGVTRTAIVNVENELELEIPKFESSDFFYTDEDGVKVPVESSQRIDLVFIYSKPIDASSTTISKFSNGAPTKITQPVLGLVKGAGIGVSFNKTNTQNRNSISLVDENGNSLMLPNVADSEGENIGFGEIKGSFPSPDDLMNISPLLSDVTISGAFSLIGQTILPVAYIVVRADSPINSNGANVISESDLIDIRPFFRTTELAYNERAGIAAATPQLSLANPVASEAYVDQIARNLTNYVVARTGGAGIETIPRLVGCGYIKGGFNYGVESTLGNVISKKFNVPESNTALVKRLIVSRYGYPLGTVINDSPDWDVAEWCKLGAFENRGLYPNDYINYHNYGNHFNTGAGLDFGAWSDAAKTNRIAVLGTDLTQGGAARGYSVIYFVKKTIQIDRSKIQWASDYYVDAQLFNCAPMTCRTHGAIQNNAVDGAGAASIWIEKKDTEFTIYVSWVANDQFGVAETRAMPNDQRDSGGAFAGFTVINSDTMTYPYAQRLVEGEIAAGVAIYPTVSFQVHGIPSSYNTAGINLQGERPIITLA